MARRKNAERTLVSDLRKQVTALVDDLRTTSDTDESLRSRLTTEHQRARTAQRIAVNYTDWREDRLTQIAVAWVLGTVFVRYCEDNELIDQPWISGPGDRLADAEDHHAQYFRENPSHNDRDWLKASFTALASSHPTVAGLFDEAHNPLWEADPSYEAAAALLKFWRTPDAEGQIPWTFKGHDTRFLGDLYQDLSEHAQKTYALLQTPEFVEEFILDLTLTPALEEFGLQPVWPHTPAAWSGPVDDEGRALGLRTIDPACGSGHFLLGLFHRILAAWDKQAPALPKWDRIRLALDSVHGCDKNPFAAAIARFRLLVAALNAAEEPSLASAPVFPLNLAVGDSLLHGREAPGIQTDLLASDEEFYYRAEDIDSYVRSADVLGRGSYHVVVGNPPYITVKDKKENENYRNAYSSCAGTYALSVPFAQRIFELAIRATGSARNSGRTGQITANSFMKREFGKNLVERYLPTVDLTHIIDTSGAFIPGHGTPTVILVGANRVGYQRTPIRAVLGKRGEPKQPEIAAEGSVWTAITRHFNQPGSESNWLSVVDADRIAFAAHPWSLSGGGASDLTQMIASECVELSEVIILPIGRAIRAGADEAFIRPLRSAKNATINPESMRGLMTGDVIRDWSSSTNEGIWYPYAPTAEPQNFQRELYPWRTTLRERRTFQGDMAAAGLSWWEYMQHTASAYQTPLSISFAEVATHNHFVLDRGGKVFKQTAPVIKLPESASEDDHLGLLGLLNSSTACFWLKQVSHDKGSQGVNEGFKSQAWERFYQFSGTKIQKFSVPAQRPVSSGRELDELAAKVSAVEPSAICRRETPSRQILDTARREHERLRGAMIARQEELDWVVYGAYGLLDRETVQRLTSIGRVPELQLGQRAFEIVLARQVAAGEEDDAWFVRHGSSPITEVPGDWDAEYAKVVQARIEMIEQRPQDIGLLERPEFKRRWSADSWEAKEKAALREWILDRCESKELWFVRRGGMTQPRTMTVGELASRLQDDADLREVARLYATDHLGKPDLPLAAILEEVVKDECVPYLAALRYKDSGLRKREAWEKTWELQRQEDREERKIDIEVPPKYTSADFRKGSYWSHRGKLDVPKERFVSYPGAALHTDDALLLGWAGWDHKDQAQALITLVRDRVKEQWGAERIAPLLAGLLEQMPWVRQWHGEYDAEWEGSPAEEFAAFLEEQLSRHELSAELLAAWRPTKEFLKGTKG
ncbi:BREX-2 system adenine-specific DNA-methyltransferase PglX [Actinocorallia aurea]